jgi:hypothetical protein
MLVSTKNSLKEDHRNLFELILKNHEALAFSPTKNGAVRFPKGDW